MELNQYFSFDVYSIASDILQIYVMDKDKITKDDKLAKINIEVSNLLNGKKINIGILLEQMEIF